MLYITKKSAAIYTPLILKLYDWWVLGVSNRFAWQCRTREVLLPFFKRHAGLRHLDVGVGTGYYAHQADFSSMTHLTFMDLNPNSLKAASKRLNRASTRLIHHDVMTNLPHQPEGAFDSISLFYLLHCLPGRLPEKCAVLGHLKHHLKPEGVLYGATILGDDVHHNAFGKQLMSVYNRRGIFDNHHDSHDALRTEMRKHFNDVKIIVHGKVALFEGRHPIF